MRLNISFLVLIFLFNWTVNPLGAREIISQYSSLNGEQKYISLDLRNIEVTDALKFLSSKAGLNIIPTKDGSGRITLMVQDVLVEDVFDIMLRSNNLAYEKQADIYNVMTEKEYKARYGRKICWCVAF